MNNLNATNGFIPYPDGVGKLLFTRGKNVKSPFSKLPPEIVKEIINFYNKHFTKNYDEKILTIFKNEYGLINNTYRVFEKFKLASLTVRDKETALNYLRTRTLNNFPIVGKIVYNDNFKALIRNLRGEPGLALSYYSMLKTEYYQKNHRFSNDAVITEEKITAHVDEKGAYLLMGDDKKFYRIYDFLNYVINDLHKNLKKVFEEQVKGTIYEKSASEKKMKLK